MTEGFDARHSVDRAFQLLTAQLEPIIATTLAPHLGGLMWTAILEERDRLRGKTPRVYVSTDPQTQLQVLTERLGSLGFPFDDHTRTVSVLGGELRIMRNRWAHHGELESLDAWRTADFVVRLLDRLGNAEGVDAAVSLREEAFVAVALEKGAAIHAAPVNATDLGAPVADASFSIPPHSMHPTKGSSSTAASNKASVTTTGAESGRRLGQDVFEAWLVVAVGGPEVIEELPKKVMKEQVRAVAAEIIEFEGPIQLKRLVQLTAASFGIVRLHAKREKSIAYQIQQIEGVTVDSSKFVWPASVDPRTWQTYRTSAPEQARDFLAISPIEIANAIRAVRDEEPSLGTSEIERTVLRLFGKSRLTSAFRTQLAKAWLQL